METLVVGAGSMGRWLGTVLRESDCSVSLSYLDAADERARAAAEATGGRAVPAGDDDVFDLVCVAVPIPAAHGAIAAHADSARHALLDVTGTMAEPIAAMREYAPDCERVSLHPLFAPANEPGNVPVVADEPGPRTDAVRAALAARDNALFETDAATHDRMMETVQARTHAAVLAFALAAETVPDRFHTPVSADLTSLAARVTGGDPRVYADIQGAFDGAGDVADAARRLAAADADEFDRLYTDAGDR